MDSQEVLAMLEQCHTAASEGPVVEATEEAKLNCQKYRESLSVELSSLLQEALDMRWPFVPEKWQYKQSLTSQDKVNQTDFISHHLSQLLALLKAAILAREPRLAAAVVFLVDRLLYWTDDSSRLLKIIKILHRHYPGTPIAPQLVLRQARVYLNSGKLQKAEYILSSLLNKSGATGCWVYRSDSDRALVQAVSMQIRGLVLQKLGLWLEAAELIWASLVGYYALPEPDKKGIGTSLGVLANILVSMNDRDFHDFKTNQDIDLSFLGDSRHHLLSAAAEAAKMAVVYSQYTSLYVLTNVVTQGTCLLSYSFSLECPPSEKHTFFLSAREAFEIGLLTKTVADLVTSKQELHTFLKAAYSLTITHKWLGTPLEVVDQARHACQEAVEKFYSYCHTDSQERDALCTEIMHLVNRVKTLFLVEPFPNSDEGSFIPDSYRDMEERPVWFTMDSFYQVMRRFQQYHVSVCEASESGCRRRKPEGGEGLQPGLCITALGTTVVTLNTECVTKNHKDTHKGEVHREKTAKPSCPQSQLLQGQEDLGPTLESTEELPRICTDKWASRSVDLVKGTDRDEEGLKTSTSSFNSSLGSSWQKVSLKTMGSPLSSSGNKESEPMVESGKENKGSRGASCRAQVGSNSSVQATSSSHIGSDVEQFEMIDKQSLIETVESEEDWHTRGGSVRPSGAIVVTHSRYREKPRTSSVSLSDSLSSQSSWQKLSLSDTHSPVSTSANIHELPQLLVPPSPSSLPANPSELGTGLVFLHIDTTNGGTGVAAPAITGKSTSYSHNLPIVCVDPEAETEADTDSHPTGPDCASSSYHNKPPQPIPKGFNSQQCLSTEMESSFELVKKEFGQVVNAKLSAAENPSHHNPLCYWCLKHGMMGIVVPESQYILTEQDYNALLAGVCHGCLLKRLQSERKFQPGKHKSANSALLLKYSRTTGLWTARETYVYIGDSIGKQGQQRTVLWVLCLHQEERLSSYVGKEYLKPKEIQFHLNDVERQMTAQYYVTEFNKRLYEKKVTAQIFFIPSEVLMILEGHEIVGCLTVEPYMLGDFVKLTNNTDKVVKSFKATDYGIAFGHFTYQYSSCQEIVVDLQGWVTANGKGLMYLTDPQIHSLKTPRCATNFAERGVRYFLEKQHGPECNHICHLLSLERLQQDVSK